MIGPVRRRFPDRLPPPPPRAGAHEGACPRCGGPVAADEGDGASPPRHLICDAGERAALLRRIEASRAVHRVATALGSVPAVQARLSTHLAALPDAPDVADVLAFLERARTVVECSSELTAPQRRIALSFLDATARKLGG